MFNLFKIFIVMCTKQRIKEKAISVELMHRDGKVTLASSNGVVISVESNDVEVALGTILAANMAACYDLWHYTELKFDIKLEVNIYSNIG